MTRYEQEYYADVKKQTKLLERIAKALEKLGKKPFEDTNQPGQAGENFDVDMRNRNNEFIDYHANLGNLSNEPELDSSGFDNNGVNHYQEKLNRYLVITGEYLGEPNIHSGAEFEKYLREILEISLNEDDFVRKSIMGITDENNDIQAIDKEKLRTFYWKEKDEIGYLETTKQEETEKINQIKKQTDCDLRKHIIKRFKADELITKKDAIIEYVKKKGKAGARYTEVIRMAYEISCGIGNFKPTQNRGYYSCAFAPRFGGHLVRGGKDHLIQPFNKTYYSNEYVQSVGMHVIEDYLNGDVNP